MSSTTAWANIVLEGSDATTFHTNPDRDKISTPEDLAAAALYTSHLFFFMQNGSSLPVLILGGAPLPASVSAISTLAPGYSLSGFTLSKFSAIYVESIGGCCVQADKAISAEDQASIAAFEAAGGNLTIENYGGGPAWGLMLPAAVNALPSSDFSGPPSVPPGGVSPGGPSSDFGTAGGPNCTDGEVVNANGLSKGFVQPKKLSCYEHQAFRTSAFTALGFFSLVDADPEYFGTDGSAFLALGGPLGTPGPGTPAVPEPATLLLLGAGLAGMAGFSWRRGRSK